MWWGLIRCRMKRKTGYVCRCGVCIWKAVLSFVRSGRGAGRWKGILCLYYLFPSFLSAGFLFATNSVSPFFPLRIVSITPFTSQTPPPLCLLSMRKWGFQLSLGILFAFFCYIFSSSRLRGFTKKKNSINSSPYVLHHRVKSKKKRWK